MIKLLLCGFVKKLASVAGKRCPKCKSKDVVMVPRVQHGFVVRMTVGWKCRKCGHEWGGSKMPAGAVG